MAIEDLTIRQQLPGNKVKKLFDGGGLYILIKPNGGKYWRMDYRFNGKRKTIALGVYPQVTLSQARIKREEIKQKIADGTDPSLERREDKLKKAATIKNTFESVSCDWWEKQLPRWSEIHAKRIIHSLAVDVFPIIGNVPISEIKAPLLIVVIRKVEKRGAPETASRILQRVRSVFNHAIQEGIIESNPTDSLTGIVNKPKEKHRLALAQDEIISFYSVLFTEPMRQETRIALMLIMILFVRNGELRHARWEDINLDKKEWHIPAHQMKMKRPHIVPLSDWALQLLNELKQITGASDYLFPSTRDYAKPISENTLGYAMNRMGYKGIAVPHGFRSLATDVLNENNFDPDVIERQMAHIEGNKIRAAYHRTKYLPQRHELMQWYSDWLREKYNQASLGTVKDD